MNSLTERQREILLAYAATGSTETAGAMLGITANTVTVQLHRIRAQLNVRTTVQAIYLVLTDGAPVTHAGRSVLEQKVTSYLRGEWLDDALQAATQAAVAAMVEAIDHRFYIERATNGDGPDGPIRDIDALHYLYQEAAGLKKAGWRVEPPPVV